jgi:hypothetical protein
VSSTKRASRDTAKQFAAFCESLFRLEVEIGIVNTRERALELYFVVVTLRALRGAMKDGTLPALPSLFYRRVESS